MADVVRSSLSYLVDLFTRSWHVNSATPSWWLTLFFVDFIHAFRMQVFLLFLVIFRTCCFALSLKRWWKVQVERCGYSHAYRNPAHSTLPQFILLQYVKEKTKNWPYTLPMKNIIRWRELISHLWFYCGAGDINHTVSIGIFAVSKRRNK